MDNAKSSPKVSDAKSNSWSRREPAGEAHRRHGGEKSLVDYVNHMNNVIVR
jgi:hypothetical protein